jgi:hypothetical protein
MTIKTPADFGRALRQPYAWPGGYPTYFVCVDGASLCHRCAKDNGGMITQAVRSQLTEEWLVVGQEVNWENASLYCDCCGDRIESAYAEDEAEAIRSGKRDV